MSDNSVILKLMPGHVGEAFVSLFMLKKSRDYELEFQLRPEALETADSGVAEKIAWHRR
jgi:hypothetical protein